jgi:hypothetical protein
MQPSEKQDSESPAAAAMASGADQAGLRLYNERLILSLVRRNRQLSKVEVARLTGLSVQTASATMNRLQTDGLLRREAPQRGRVGQPTVPLSLDPEGAFSLGLKIGRRSCELVLVDFDGKLRRRAGETFGYPTPALVLDFVSRELPVFLQTLSVRQRRRVAGLGVASPFQLWSWGPEIGAPPGAMDDWRTLDIEREIAAFCDFPVTLCNDATSACAAELFFGEAWRRRDFLYFFLGSFYRRRPCHRRRPFSGPHRQCRGCRLDARRIARRKDGRAFAIDRACLDMPARAQGRGGRPRSVLDLANAGGLGRFRPHPRRPDRDGVRRSRLCLRGGDFCH